MIRRIAFMLLAGSALAVAATSCAVPAGVDDANPSSPASSASEGQLARAGCVAVASDESAPAATAPANSTTTVLTVTGQFATGSENPAQLDMRSLDALPQVECSVDDRLAEGHQVTFRGVLLSTLLASIGARPSSTLHMTALNDYAVDVPVTDIRDLPVLLATRADGAPMTVAHYGPLRIIYPTTGFDLDPTIYDPRRIWQMSSIDVQ